MVPTSQGFTEVRDVFFKEVTDMNLNVINEGGIDKLGEVSQAWPRVWVWVWSGRRQALTVIRAGRSPPGHNL